jgi:hypothetical protein
MTMIRAGTPEEVSAESGEWLIVDAGFSSNGRSCGVVGANDAPTTLTFSETRTRLIRAGAHKAGTLNLLIEAPLSAAFNAKGNPTGRTFERFGSQHRYWYEGLGCLVMTSALYLLRELSDSGPEREVRLFEGFVSFKPKGVASSHCGDVLALRSVVLDSTRKAGSVIPASQIAMAPSDRLVSAFAVAGMELGIPAVVKTIANIGLPRTAAGGIKDRRG